MSYLADGVRNTLAITREWATGAAKRNATGQGAGPGKTMPTTVAWTLTKPLPVQDLSPQGMAIAKAKAAKASEQAWHHFWGSSLRTRVHDRWAALSIFGRKMMDVADADGRFRVRAENAREFGRIVMHLVRMESFDDTLYRGVEFDNSTCLTTQTFCQQCYLMDQVLGTSVLAINTSVAFYTSDNPPRPESTLAELLADYDRVESQLFANRTTFVHLGDSDDNPALFPNKQRGWWANYLNDPIPGKIGFTDIQPLIDATIAWFESLFNNASIDSPPTSASMISLQPDLVASAGLGGSRFTSLRPDVVTVPMTRILARGLRTLIESRNQSVTSTIRIASSAGPYDTFSQIALGWLDYILGVVYRCDWPTLLNSSGLRFSLAQGFMIVLVPISILGFAALAIPSFATVIFGVAGLVTVIVLLVSAFALSTGWAYTCAFAVPPVVWTRMAMHLFTDVIFPPCFIYFMSLVQQTEFQGQASNRMCARCDLWQNRNLTMGNCFRDYGWVSIVDVPVYFLKVCFSHPLATLSTSHHPPQVYAPTFLASLQDPMSWPFPLSWLIGTALLQDALRRFDTVDLNTDDPLAYAHVNGCPYIIGVSTIILFYAIGVLLLSFLPARAIFNFVRAVLAAILLSGAMLSVSLAAQTVFLTMAPLDMAEASDEMDVL